MQLLEGDHGVHVVASEVAVDLTECVMELAEPAVELVDARAGRAGGQEGEEDDALEGSARLEVPGRRLQRDTDSIGAGMSRIEGDADSTATAAGSDEPRPAPDPNGERPGDRGAHSGKERETPAQLAGAEEGSVEPRPHRE